AERIGAGEKGISGLMVESFLEAGAQSVEAEPLVYGQSVTDACIGWDTTADSLRSLAEAVRRSRGVTSRENLRVVASHPLDSLYEKRLRASLDESRLPRHVAVMADGNRRWAKEAG